MENSKELRKIVLIVTQKCNLACEYCYEKYKTPQNMSVDMAKQIIDSEIDKYGKTHKLTVEFFGGEPFLNFELIKTIVEYTEKKYHNLAIKYCATTNGTVISDDIKKWLINNQELFECAISVDGNEYMHNINRPYKDGKGSFESIDIDFFLSLYGENNRVKMTISKKTLPYLTEGIKYLDSINAYTVADMVAAEEYWEQKDIPVLEQQLIKLADYYIQNSEKRLCRMLDYDLRRVFMDSTMEFKYCGAGKNMITYDVNGKWYPCMALAPISQGKKAIKFIHESFDKFEMSSSNKCKECKLLRLCRNCYATNYNQTGSIQCQTAIQCVINRMLVCTSARIQYHRIKKKSELSDNDKIILKSIYNIMEILNTNDFLQEEAFETWQTV